MSSFTADAKPATTFTKEALPRSGTNIAAKFGTAIFGRSRFGFGSDNYEWNKTAKPATTFTKDALPA